MTSLRPSRSSRSSSCFKGKMQKPMGFWSCVPSKTIKRRTFNRSVLSIHLEYDHPFDQLNVVQPPCHSSILPFHWLVGNDDHPQCILDSVTPKLIINQQGLWTWLKILKIPSNPHGCFMVWGCHSHGYQPPRRASHGHRSSSQDNHIDRRWFYHNHLLNRHICVEHMVYIYIYGIYIYGIYIYIYLYIWHIYIYCIYILYIYISYFPSVYHQIDIGYD